MKLKEFFTYLFIMFGVTYLIRVIPFVAIKSKINNQWMKSFLYYIPYSVLAAMTFPAVLYATSSMLSAFIGLLVAVVFSYRGESLTKVAMLACIAVFLTELFL